MRPAGKTGNPLPHAYCDGRRITARKRESGVTEIVSSRPLPRRERLLLAAMLKDPLSFCVVTDEERDLLRAEAYSNHPGGDSSLLSASEDLASPDSPAVVVARGLLTEALRRGASDLHCHLHPKAMRTEFRTDGILAPHLSFPPAVGAGVLRRLLLQAGLDPFSQEATQEGRLALPSPGGIREARLSLLRESPEELTLALRFFPRPSERLAVDQIFLLRESRKKVQRVAGMNEGLVLLCGPTGSGKSTTLHAILLQEARRQRRVVTLERPVEQRDPRFMQLDLTDSDQPRRMLEAALRQDPDIIVIGEIRGPEELAFCIEAALTGHLVFSTLHASGVTSAMERILELGGNPAGLLDSLRAILCQRLRAVRRRSPGTPASPPDPTEPPPKRVALFESVFLTEKPFDGAYLDLAWWLRYLERSGYCSFSDYRRGLHTMGIECEP